MKFSLLSTAASPVLWAEVCANNLSVLELSVTLVNAAGVAAVIRGSRGRRVTHRAAVYVYDSLIDGVGWRRDGDASGVFYASRPL